MESNVIPLFGPRIYSELFYSWIQVSLVSKQEIKLPEFDGSFLRGAFGHALRETACVNPELPCMKCIHTSRCLYFQIFETTDPSQKNNGFVNKPHPYILKLDKANPFSSSKEIHFSMILLGDWSLYLPYLVYSFKKMGELGLGKNRIPFQLKEVRDAIHQEILYQNGKLISNHLSLSSLRDYVEKELDKGNYNYVLLNFLTPVKFVRKGIEENRLTEESLIFFVKHRYETIHRFYGKFYPYDLENFHLSFRVVEEDHLSWSRYSNRQGKKHPMSGILGSYVIYVKNARFAEILKTFEILHLGKNTTFGLGEVRVMPV